MADYPGTVPVFTTLVDDVDDVLAAHQNTPNDEISALATAIGSIGTGLTQASAIDLLAFLQNYRHGLTLSFVDVNTIQVSTGIILCVNSGVSQRVLRKNTSTTNVTFSDIDTGARATSTTYYVWAIADAVGTTVTFKISLSSSAPASSTRYALLGKFSTNSTGAGEIVSSSISNIFSSAPPGSVVQSVSTVTGEVATGTTVMPFDDTIPQNTEGIEFMTQAITPNNASNKLRIEVVFYGCPPNDILTVALFQDSTANALAAGTLQITSGGGGAQYLVAFTYEMTAGTANSTTFKVRAGGSGAGTTTFNGIASARKLGGVMASSITITEIKV